MAWCPVCKNEYKEGYSVCSDCKVDLVDSLEAGPVAIYFGEQEELENIESFLRRNHITSGFIGYDDTEKQYELFVAKEDSSQTKKMILVYLQQEQQNAITETEDMDEDEEESSQPRSTIYVNKKEQAEEYKSSAYSLCIVGIFGLAFIALHSLGVIPITFNSTTKYMLYFVMGLMFIVFIVVGIRSMASSQKLLSQSKEEDNMMEQAMKYLQEKLPRDSFQQSESEDEEQKAYFVRIESMKDCLKDFFPEMDNALAERLADDYYDSIF